MRNSIDKRQKFNSFAFVFLIYIYSITTVFSLVTNQGITIVVISVLVIGPILLNNINHLKKRVISALLLELLVLIILLIHKQIYFSNSDEINNIFLQFLGLGTISILVGILDTDSYFVEKNFDYLSIVCFFTSFLYLVLIRGSFFYSMRFGYALLPSSIWFLCSYIKRRKIGWLLLFIVSVLLLMVYGSRGTLLSIGLLLVLMSVRFRWWWVLFFSLLFILFSDVFLRFLEGGVQWLAEISGARKVQGLLALFQGDIMDSSSGRDELYERCILLFKENPLGIGIGFWQSDPFMNGLYPHNIFLEIAVEFGIIGIFVFVIILGLLIVRLFRLDKSLFFPYAALFAICFGRLLVSSMYWSRPEFWLILSFFLFNFPRNKQEVLYRE